MSRERLIELYAEMAVHTAPECAQTCRVPHLCCDPLYCEAAVRWAKEHWGVELVKTDHLRLPLMGPTGCTAAPHLRPLCTLHTCEVNSLGFKRADKTWNEKYFELREAIENMEQ